MVALLGVLLAADFYASRMLLRLAVAQADAGPAMAQFRVRLWALSLLFVLLASATTFWISRSVSSRIRKLQEFSARIGKGNFSPLEMSGEDSRLDSLQRELNQTAANLGKTIGFLTDERNRSAAILRSMIEGVAVISAQERVLFSNRAFSQILGLDSVSVEGRTLIEAIRQSDLLAITKRALAGQEEISSEIVVGTVRPRSFAVTAAPVQADGPAGAVLVLHDISELRRLERVRQDFVANVSHEFRTPLTAIQGFAETLLGGALDDQANRRRFVEIIRDHAARLARLTEDLLKLSRIEAGQLNLEFRPVSVYQLVESCLETARLKAASKQLSIEAEIPENLPPVRGDANRLQELLQNLLDNALQYTPPGGKVTLAAAREGDRVTITVADTGIGIPQAEQTRIFERFYRVDAARSREAGGTGLGLSIARHIVDAHSGRLWLESTVGEGSLFHFSIPVSS
jgi:two-component system, OmpR family, phosphate regulon sensor histidine kinase PhoR